MKNGFFVGFFALVASSLASADQVNLSGWSFSAPVISNTSDVQDVQRGDIVYQTDTTSGFYGYDGTSWVNFGGGGSANVTSNSSGQERVERVQVSSTCSSNPCTVTSQSGSWVSSITRSSAGLYTLNIASGIFSAEPTCTISGSGGDSFCTPFVSSATVVSIRCMSSAVSGSFNVLGDAGLNIVCMGPKP